MCAPGRCEPGACAPYCAQVELDPLRSGGIGVPLLPAAVAVAVVVAVVIAVAVAVGCRGACAP